ncbi:30S ribosomal protein S19 [Candidatus Woesearchaeota archaeon]|jgi:small subunit ribosomal protein S19|nr:30S ribosomal protein S19 [Candidatus Woesearchaeota archaeon]
MAKKEFFYRGKNLEELQEMGLKELAALLPAAARRKIQRGFTEQEKVLLKNLKTSGKPVKTHCRSMIILPEMVNKTIKVYNGKTFEDIIVQPEMIGHYLGEFSLTRKRVAHSAPGVGATRSSSNISVK